MPGKVVHISEATHTKMMAFCKEHNLNASEWVCSLIRHAIIESRIPVEKKKPQLTLPIPPPPVYISPSSNESEKDIYSRPPFWKGR